MAYFPKVDVPNTFYINAGSSGSGSKGNPATPYATPWDVAGDLSSNAEVLRFTPGTFTYAGPYDANNSHVANAENTFYDAIGATIIADSAATATGTLFSDVTGAGTDEARLLKIVGGEYESNTTGASTQFMFQFLNGNSKLNLDMDRLWATGEDSGAIELGGSISAKIKEVYTEGNYFMHLVGESNGAGPQTNTIGRRVYFEVDQLEADGFGTADLIYWGNGAANYTETNMVFNGYIKRANFTSRTVAFGFLLDGFSNVHVNCKIDTAIVDSGQNNAFFEMGSWNLSFAPVLNSNFVFEIGSSTGFGGRIVGLERLDMDSSNILLKCGTILADNQPANDSYIALDDIELTNNSSIVIDIGQFYDTSSNADSIVRIRSGVNCDATSKIIIKGAMKTTQAKPLILIGDTDAVIVLQDVTLENDGTVAAIQTESGATPTVYVAGAFDVDSPIIAGAGITISPYTAYV